LIFYIPQEGLKTFVDDDDEDTNLIPIDGKMEISNSSKTLLSNLIEQSQNNLDENFVKKNKILLMI